MKVIPLSQDEGARTGWNTVVNLKVTATGVGDIAIVSAAGQNVTAAPIGTVCQCAGIDVKAAWAGMTTPTISVAFAASVTSGTNIINASTAIATTGTVAVFNPTAAVTTASQFVTIANGGSVASATAGEANLLLRLVDITASRNSFV